MSSGTAKSRYWILEFVAEGARRKDAYTGWNSIDGTANQVKLRFDTLEEAQTYAAAQGLSCELISRKSVSVCPSLILTIFAMTELKRFSF